MKFSCSVGIILTVLIFAINKDEKFKDLDKYVKPAERILSSEEVTKLVELTIKILQSKDWGERLDACREIAYDIGHKAAIPVLVAVITNPKELMYVRSGAIQALANIPDKEAIEKLLKIAEEGIKRKERVIYDTAFYVLHRLLQLSHIDLKEEPPREIRNQKLWEEAKGSPEKQLAIYKALWEWQKDKPIDMRKRVYIMRMRSWH